MLGIALVKAYFYKTPALILDRDPMYDRVGKSIFPFTVIYFSVIGIVAYLKVKYSNYLVVFDKNVARPLADIG